MAVKENKVTYGLENVHYALLTFGESSVPTFGKPVAIKGGVELALDPETESVAFAADNDANYFAEDANNGYSGTLTIANMPLSFQKDILGEVENVADGTITELADAKFKPFALLFQFDGDKTKTRHLLYYCTASRAKIGSKTGKDISGAEISIKSKQLEVNNRKLVKTKTTSDEATKYVSWFEDVYIETVDPAEG